MAERSDLLITVNSGADKPYSQYAAHAVAFMAERLSKSAAVTVSCAVISRVKEYKFSDTMNRTRN